MAILNFPINPSHNDAYSANGIDYSYDSTSTSWVVQANLGYTGSQGFTGSKGAGFTGSRGLIGYAGSRGFTGSSGFTGSVGYTGSSNVQGIRYGYDTGTTVTGALSGEIRFNNATLGSATQIGINTIDADGNDLTSYFSTLDNYGSNILKGTLLFKPVDLTSGEFAAFNVTTVFTNNSGVLTATITSAGGGLTLSDGDEIIVTFSPAVVGDQGYTGSQGVIGYTGSQGVIGYTGSQGDIGYTGSQGVIGYTGSQGIIGYTGSKGDIGYTGSKGDIGYTGSRGSDGTSVTIAGSVADVNVNPPNNPQTTLNNNFGSAVAGNGVVDQATGNLWVYDGATWNNVGQFVGYTGSQGVGYTGSQGEIGYTGSRGATGFTGSQGYTGSQGDIGYTGSRGEVGFTGSQGVIGYTGSQGVIGYTGSQGVIGYTGSQGVIGFTGSQGTTGFDGSQGTTGFTGSAGADASLGKSIAMAIIFG